MDKSIYTQNIAKLKHERDKSIYADWQRMKGTAARYNICLRLAVEYGMSHQGIDKIIKRLEKNESDD